MARRKFGRASCLAVMARDFIRVGALVAIPDLEWVQGQVIRSSSTCGALVEFRDETGRVFRDWFDYNELEVITHE